MRLTREHQLLNEKMIAQIIEKRHERRSLRMDRERDAIACRIYDARVFARKQRERMSMFSVVSSRKVAR